MVSLGRALEERGFGASSYSAYGVHDLDDYRSDDSSRLSAESNARGTSAQYSTESSRRRRTCANISLGYRVGWHMGAEGRAAARTSYSRVLPRSLVTILPKAARRAAGES
jgi:hypothetical protein